jgi:two-component system chemotaxis response regulator CheB
MSDPVSVLVVDDSALMRNLVSRIVENTPGLVVADKAMNGIFALQKIPRCNPDVIVLDIEMPGMNGIEFLQERKKLGLEIPVVILSSVAKRGAQITMDALALGASDFITKPSGSISTDIHVVAVELGRLLLAYGSQYQRQKGKTPPAFRFDVPEEMFDIPEFKPIAPARPAKPVEKIVPARDPGPLEILALGISTGGPNALREVFSSLPGDFPLPVVVVQHMPAGFTEEFARSLDRVCTLEVKEAAEGDVVRKGRILIAPGDYHMTVERKSLATVAHLNKEGPMNGHRPSVDVLFASVAKEFGHRAMAVIMTGMGKDGAVEIGSIYKAGGICVGQDEASSVVYGMPKVAWELGHLTERVSLDDMAVRLTELATAYR